MNKTIHIREAVTPEEVECFWQELHAYHARDIFPDPAEEDRAYFLDDSQYRAAVQHCTPRRTASASSWSSVCCRSSGAAGQAPPAPVCCWIGQRIGERSMGS